MWLEEMLEALLIADFYIVCGRCAHEGYQLRGSVESFLSHVVKKCCVENLSSVTVTVIYTPQHTCRFDSRCRMVEQRQNGQRAAVYALIEVEYVPCRD